MRAQLLKARNFGTDIVGVHVRSLTIDQEGADRSHASGILQCTIDIDTNSLATASSKARGRGKCPYLKRGVLRFRPSR